MSDKHKGLYAHVQQILPLNTLTENRIDSKKATISMKLDINNFTLIA